MSIHSLNPGLGRRIATGLLALVAAAAMAVPAGAAETATSPTSTSLNFSYSWGANGLTSGDAQAFNFTRAL